KKGVVKDFRGWRNTVLEDIDKGRAITKQRKEMAQLTEALTRELKADGGCEITVKAKVSAKGACFGPVPKAEIGGEVEVEKSIDLGAAFHWLLMHIPGYRYRKLLMQLVIAQREYMRIDKHLEKIWQAG